MKKPKPKYIKIWHDSTQPEIACFFRCDNKMKPMAITKEELNNYLTKELPTEMWVTDVTQAIEKIALEKYLATL